MNLEGSVQMDPLEIFKGRGGSLNLGEDTWFLLEALNGLDVLFTLSSRNGAPLYPLEILTLGGSTVECLGRMM